MANPCQFYLNGTSAQCTTPYYFDTATQKCASCPTGTYLEAKKCITYNCPASYTFDMATKLCVCPSARPL